MKLGEPLLPPLGGSTWKLVFVQQPWTSQSFSVRMEHQTMEVKGLLSHLASCLPHFGAEILDYTKIHLCLPQYLHILDIYDFLSFPFSLRLLL